MRFRQRRKVDLPQPLGPIIEVTALEGMSIVTLSIACFSPYHTDKSLIWNVSGACAVSVAASIVSPRRSRTIGSGDRIVRLTIRRFLHDGRLSFAGENPH